MGNRYCDYVLLQQNVCEIGIKLYNYKIAILQIHWLVAIEGDLASLRFVGLCS